MTSPSATSPAVTTAARASREWDALPRFVDSHFHPDLEGLRDDVPAVLERGRRAGVCAFVAVAAGLGSWENPVRLAREHGDVYATVGCHPHDVKDLDEAGFARIAELARLPEVVAVGETGLDYFYKLSPREQQVAWFERHLELALEVGKPAVVHARDSLDDLVEIAARFAARGVRGVVHCYTGDAATARKLMELGWLVSFTGILTFRNADELRATAKSLPIDRLMIETDAPYLAPVPHRGKGPNEPAYVVRVAETLATLFGLTVADVARITTTNARRFFGLDLDGSFEIAYRIRNSLYLNITNRCTIACVFCGKFKDFTVKGHDLRLRGGEPSVERILDAIGDPTGLDEVVFCGYGEPTLRLDVVKEVAARVHAMGKRVRLNTDGLGNLVHGRDIVPELVGVVDTMSVSLNAQDAPTYARVCPSKHGEAAYPKLLEFLRSVKAHRLDAQVSVVAPLDGVDVEACKRIADDLGLRFRVRPFDEIG
ncbi:MAG: YchF/TatD family DNA exonuclease [Deltaproteobacteria bacterium]|nr:YchF/TatD family DNA exonuclease [Deltaproteobacteria bacterium]